MKIGILTLPFNNNYGGYLQAFALMYVLKKQGHDVYLIDRRHNIHDYSVIVKLKGIVKRYIFGKHAVYSLKTREESFNYRGKKILEFVEKNISPKTGPIYSSLGFENIVKYGFDAIIVGSDQVWRPEYVPNIEDFYLGFSKDWDVRRISYAASFGTDKPDYTDTEIKNCGELIRLFYRVSTRESSGETIINKHFKWNYPHIDTVLDPTLLLSAEQYIEICNIVPEKKRQIFVYLLDNNEYKIRQVNKLSKYLDLEPLFFLPESRDSVLPSIEDFISGFANSEFVLTDSFHGTVFSIIFNKDFLVFGNADRGQSRFIDLLSRFGLKNRLISNDEFSLEDIDTIDWDKVNGLKSKSVAESYMFLNDATSV